LGQSGSAGFSCEQHGIPSVMDAMSSIAGTDAAAIATDGAAIGAISRLTTARIESRRGRRGQNFTIAISHMLQCKKRADRSHFRQKQRMFFAQARHKSVHGWRSTFQSWCGANGVDREVGEKALARNMGIVDDASA
jgi:hypothetical protein